MTASWSQRQVVEAVARLKRQARSWREAALGSEPAQSSPLELHLDPGGGQAPAEASPGLASGLDRTVGQAETTTRLEPRPVVSPSTVKSPKAHRHDPYAWGARARAEENAERWLEAAEAWAQLAEREPSRVAAWAGAARALRKLGRTEDAARTCQSALLLHPDAREMLVLMGWVQMDRQEWEGAAATWIRVTELDPTAAYAHRGLGWALSRLGRSSQALVAFQRCLELTGDDPVILLHCGRGLRALGRRAEALAIFEKLCRLQPEDPRVWLETVVLLMWFERANEAAEVCARANAHLPDTPRGLLLRAQIAEGARLEAEADRWLDGVLRLAAGDAGTLAALAEMRLRRGQLDAALLALQAAREADPDDDELIRKLSSVLATLRRLDLEPHDLPSRGPVLLPEAVFERIAKSVAGWAATPAAVPGRVAVVTDSLAMGGAGRQVAITVAGLRGREGVESVVLFSGRLSSSGGGFFLPIVEQAGVETVEYGSKAMPSKGPGLDLVRGGSPVWAPRLELLRALPEAQRAEIEPLFCELVARRPAVVHAWQDTTSIWAGVAAVLAGVPRVVLSTRSLPPTDHRRSRRHLRDCYRSLLRLPQVVLSNNSVAGARDYEAWLDLPQGTIQVVFNGLDVPAVLAARDADLARTLRSHAGFPVNALVVGSAMRFTEVKRPLLWLEVASAIVAREPRAHFVLVGSGPMSDAVHQRARELGLSHRLHLPGAETRALAWLQAMDVVLLTSHREGTPNVLLEAQALGRPVVAPAVGGVRDAVDEGRTGWVVDDHGPAAFAERVLDALARPEWREQVQESGPRFVEERFGLERMLGSTLALYGPGSMAPSLPLSAPVLVTDSRSARREAEALSRARLLEGVDRPHEAI